MISGKIKAHFGVSVLVSDGLGAELRVKVGRNSGHVVGDNVEIVADRLKRLERHNQLIRGTPFGEQVLAANLDYVGIVISITPKTSPYFIDQVIMACRTAHIEPFVVVTKLDVPGTENFLKSIRDTYTDSVSVIAGISELHEFLRKKARFIFVGISGAGKSSLINQLIPNANQKIGSLSEHRVQGRHTTSGSVLLDLPDGGELIDSPGVRDFTPVDLSPGDLAHYFPGFEKFMEMPCKFRDCKHLGEPGCIVREQASPEVYQRYLDFARNDNFF